MPIFVLACLGAQGGSSHIAIKNKCCCTPLALELWRHAVSQVTCAPCPHILYFNNSSALSDYKQLRLQSLVQVLGPEVAYSGLCRAPRLLLGTESQQAAASHAALQVSPRYKFLACDLSLPLKNVMCASHMEALAA
jgi:hypothetical protein